MGAKRSYQLETEPPYIPKAILAARFEAKLAAADADGCRLWLGSSRHPRDPRYALGRLRLPSPTGNWTANAPAIALYLAGHPWLETGHRTVRTCGKTLCCTVEHLKVEAPGYRRRLTTEQVLAARAEWAEQEGVVRWGNAMHYVVAHTGLFPETIERIVGGGRGFNTVRWRDFGGEEHEVRALMMEAAEDWDRRMKRREKRLTMAQMAKKYGISQSNMSHVLNDISYAEVKLPPKPAPVVPSRPRLTGGRAAQASLADDVLAYITP